MVPLVLVALATFSWPITGLDGTGEAHPVVKLPPPRVESDVSIEETLKRRRSIREWSRRALEVDLLSQLLWAAQGVTDGRQHRTAPSAGATYPIEILVVVGEEEDVEAGVYRYRPSGHRMVRVLEGDLRRTLVREAQAQEWTAEAPVVLVITAVVGRTAPRYGSRAERYVQIEAGAVAQNIYLQAEALRLGTVLVGAFSDVGVRRVLELEAEEKALALMPVGHRG